jgi:hypothetical protein
MKDEYNESKKAQKKYIEFKICIEFKILFFFLRCFRFCLPHVSAYFDIAITEG